MKKRVKIISVLLIAVMLLGLLSACGGNGEEAPEPTLSSEAPEPTAGAVSGEDKLVWTMKDLIPGLPSDYGVHSAAVVGDCVMIAGEYLMNAGVRANTAGFFRLETSGKLTELKGFSYKHRHGNIMSATEEMVENKTQFGDTTLSLSSATPDGEFLVLEAVSLYHYEHKGEGEDLSYTPYTAVYDEGREYYLHWFDTELNETATLDVTGLLPDGMGIWYLSGGKDRTAAAVSGQEVAVFSADEGLIFHDSAVGNVTRLISLTGGGFAVIIPDMQNGAKPSFCAVDLAEGKLGTPTILDGVNNYYPGAGEYSFFYEKYNTLCGRPVDGSEDVEILSLTDCGVYPDNLQSFTPLSETKAFGIIRSSAYSSGFDFEIFSLIPESEAPRRVRLSLATLGLDSTLRSLVIDFNNSSKTYKIDVIDYNQYNTSDDYTLGIQRLMTDIGAGNIPDILDMMNLPLNTFVSHDLLVDLNGFLDKDAELGRDDLLPGVLNALEYDGALYTLPHTFAVSTLTGRPELIGSEPGWTFEEMKAAIDAQSPDFHIFGTTSRTILFLNMFSYNVDRFVDTDSRTCDFENETFYDMLAAVARATDERSSNEEFYNARERMFTGQQLLNFGYIYSFEDMMIKRIECGGECVFKGFPTDEGCGYYLEPLVCNLAISTACEDPDVAWEFIKHVQENGAQTPSRGFRVLGFSVTVSGYEAMKTAALAKEANGGAGTGETVSESKGTVYITPDIRCEYYSITPEEAETMDFIVANLAGCSTGIDASIQEILLDNIPAYFAGDKSAEDTARLIESSVSIYLSEQS